MNVNFKDLVTLETYFTHGRAWPLYPELFKPPAGCLVATLSQSLINWFKLMVSMLPFKKIKINKKKPHDSEKMNHTTDLLEGLHFVRHDTIGQSTQLYQSDMEE